MKSSLHLIPLSLSNGISRRIGVAMSGKYAFTKTLKELRFLHCQTSEHSNAVRYAINN
jgi:hypothetical protein